MKKELASFISVIGHPLLTISIFSIITFFTYEEPKQALLHSLLIVAGIVLPLAVKMYLNAKKGMYTNFDVSDQSQRQSWYVYAILVLLIVTILLFITDQSRTLRLSVLFSLILMAASQVMNFFIKSSLHVSFNIFLSFLIITMNVPAGILVLIFTVLIIWSRVTLKRHTIKEIITGAVLGFTVGIFSLYFIH